MTLVQPAMLISGSVCSHSAQARSADQAGEPCDTNASATEIATAVDRLSLSQTPVVTRYPTTETNSKVASIYPVRAI